MRRVFRSYEVMNSNILQHDAALKARLLKRVRADFQARHLYHPLTDAQLAELLNYFKKKQAGKDPPFPDLDKSNWSYPFGILIEVIEDFLADRPLDILKKTPFLYPWARTSDALKNMVEATEYLVRSHARPRVGAYAANGGNSAVSFCVSYPRSGNTLFTNIFNHLIPESRHSVFWSDGRFISRYAREVISPGDMIVKDHLLCNEQLRNKIFYIVRDFREVLRSQILFLFKEFHRDSGPLSAFSSAHAFLEFSEQGYKFGSWEEHVSGALSVAQSSSNIKIVKYEDLESARGGAVIQDCMNFLGKQTTLDLIVEARAASKEVKTSLLEKNQVWAEIKAAKDLPDLVRIAQSSSLPDWYRQLPRRDQDCIDKIIAGPVSAALQCERGP